MPGEGYFLGQFSFHGAGPSEIGFALHGEGKIPPCLKRLNPPKVDNCLLSLA